jgi:hypothetical protein
MKLYLTAVLSLLILPVFGQSVQYRFRVRYEDKTLVVNRNFLINGEDYGTDDHGIFDKVFPERLSFVTVSAKSESDFFVVYPADGIVLLPKEGNALIEIIVRKRSTSKNLEVVNDLQGSRKVVKAINKSERKILNELKAESGRLDSMLALLKGNELNRQVIEAGRLRNFPLISASLNQYLNEVRDLNDSFSSLGLNLENKQAYEQYSAAVSNYNEIYELLNTNKGVYEQAVDVYWHKELALKYSNLMEFVVEDLHRPYILNINYTFQPRIYSFLQERNKRKKKEIREQLKREIQLNADEIGRRINILGERVTSFNSILSNYNR